MVLVPNSISLMQAGAGVAGVTVVLVGMIGPLWPDGGCPVATVCRLVTFVEEIIVWQARNKRVRLVI